MNQSEKFETGCCPRFHPEAWEKKEVVFKDKLFLKDHVTSLFHIPLNFGRVMSRSMAKIEKAHALASEQVVLSDETSPWGADVYIAATKQVPDAKMERISGTFLTRVFEGSYNKMDKYIEEMQNYVKSKGKKVGKFYFYYPYCPKCSNAYGKNFIVILAQV